jgi:membrane-associated protein
MLELLDRFVTLLQSTVDSPWLWLIVFLVTMLDALIPFSPSETTLVTVAVLVTPRPELLALLVLVAAVGAFAGDCASHAMGRFAGPGMISRFSRGEKGRERVEWARAKVHEYAVLLILVARYLPGGRFASGIATGGVRYPWPRFLVLDGIGTTLWAAYGALVGYIGGRQFTDSPAKGLLLAFAIALLGVVVVEAGRRIWARSQTSRRLLEPQREDARA